MALVGDDCYYYFYSSCAKGEKCPYRHCSAARGKEVMCKRWLAGGCALPGCSFRHMMLQKDRSQIPCWFETQPTGCLKAHCPFKHLKPRSVSANDVSQTGDQTTSPAPENVVVQAAVEEPERTSEMTAAAQIDHRDTRTMGEASQAVTIVLPSDVEPVANQRDHRDTRTMGEASQAVTVVLPSDVEPVAEQRETSKLGHAEQAQSEQLQSQDARKRARLDRFRNPAPLTTSSRSPLRKRPVASDGLSADQQALAAKRRYRAAMSTVRVEPARRVPEVGVPQHSYNVNGQATLEQSAAMEVRSLKEIMAEKQAKQRQEGVAVSAAVEQKPSGQVISEAERRARRRQRFEQRRAELVAVAAKEEHLQTVAEEEHNQPMTASNLKPGTSLKTGGEVHVMSFQEIMMQKRKNNSGQPAGKDQPKELRRTASDSLSTHAVPSLNETKPSSPVSVSTKNESGKSNRVSASAKSRIGKPNPVSLPARSNVERTDPVPVSLKNGIKKAALASASSKNGVEKSNPVPVSSKNNGQKSSKPPARRLSRASSKLTSEKVSSDKPESQSVETRNSAVRTGSQAKETPTKLALTKPESQTLEAVESPSSTMLNETVVDDDEFMRTLKDFDVKGDLLDDDLLLDVEGII